MTCAYGLLVAIGVSMGVSGAGINPAVCFGINLMATLFFDIPDAMEFKFIWIYFVGPILGGLLAGAVYQMLHYNTCSTVRGLNNEFGIETTN